MGTVQEQVTALLFDTWGTVVDWHSSVLEELRALGQRKGLVIDWEEFLAEWRSAYSPGMQKVNRGERPWTRIGVLYREALERLLSRYRIDYLTDEEIDDLNRAWTRTRPWPDSLPGMTRLRREYVLSPLSNASFAWLVDIARFAVLPFDCIISAENARWYKPRPEVYLTALDLLGRRPAEVMLVASHNYDLAAARSHGMRTAFIPRPTELGPRPNPDLRAEQEWDVIAEHMIDLAEKMCARE